MDQSRVVHSGLSGPLDRDSLWVELLSSDRRSTFTTLRRL